MAQDHYKILEVAATATEEEITRAYRAKLRTWHPDAWPDHRKAYAQEHFKKITWAYQVLSNREKRAAFDKERAPEKLLAPDAVQPFVCPECGVLTPQEKVRRLKGKKYCDICFWKLVYAQRDQG